MTDKQTDDRINNLQREINDLRSDHYKLFNMMESMAEGAVERERRLEALELRTHVHKIS